MTNMARRFVPLMIATTLATGGISLASTSAFAAPTTTLALTPNNGTPYTLGITGAEVDIGKADAGGADGMGWYSIFGSSSGSGTGGDGGNTDIGSTGGGGPRDDVDYGGWAGPDPNAGPIVK